LQWTNSDASRVAFLFQYAFRQHKAGRKNYEIRLIDRVPMFMLMFISIHLMELVARLLLIVQFCSLGIRTLEVKIFSTLLSIIFQIQLFQTNRVWFLIFSFFPRSISLMREKSIELHCSKHFTKVLVIVRPIMLKISLNGLVSCSLFKR